MPDVYFPNPSSEDDPFHELNINPQRSPFGYSSAVGSGSSTSGRGFSGGGLRGFAPAALAMRGYRSFAEDIKLRGEESAASKIGDAESYLKAQTKEYDGLAGDARYGVQSVYSYLSARGDGFMGAQDKSSPNYVQNPAEQEAELQAAVAKAKQDQVDEKNARRELANNASEKQNIIDEQNNATESGIVGVSDRAGFRDSVDYRDGMKKAADLQTNWTNYTNDHSVDGYNKIQDEARQLSSAVASQYANQTTQQVQQQEQANKEALSRAKVADLEMAGDSQGADRERTRQQIAEQSQRAHRESAESGALFDSKVAPELQAQEEKKLLDQRVNDAQESANKIIDIESNANASRLKASGQLFEAEKSERFKSLDDQVAALQLAVNRETDVRKKSLLQNELDATRRANEQQKRDFQAGHDREDQIGANNVALRDVAQEERFAGNTETAGLIDQAASDADRIRNLRGQGKNKEADAIAKKWQDGVPQAQADYQYDQRMHGLDVEEEDSGFRANGQGAMADENDLQNREAERIRRAMLSGDSSRVAQAQRTAENNLNAYVRQNQQRPQEFGSVESYEQSFLLSSYNDNGLSQAVNAAKTAAGVLAGGGMLGGDQSGNDLNAAAGKLGDSAAALDAFAKKLIDQSIQLVVLKKN